MKMLIQTLLIGGGKVGVRGDACSGKTSVLYGAMQIFGEKNKSWNVIRITNEEHLRACYDKQNVLLVIDDILDQNSYMLNHLDTLKNYIDKGYWKVIFSYSNESYKTMESNTIKYSDLDGDNEKIGILNSHCMHIGYTLPEETSKQCVESCAPIDFFQNPIKEMVRDLELLKASNPLGFYILFRCSILGGDFDIFSTSQKNEFNDHSLEISKWLLASNNPDQKTFLKRLQCEGMAIPGEFAERIGKHKYRIKFCCVVRGVQLTILKELNITSLPDAGTLLKHAVFLCDFSIIRTFLRGDDKVVSPLLLKIHEDNFRHVAERFIEEIQSGHVQKVGQHPLFSNDEFKRTFSSKLRSKHDEKFTWDIFSKLDKQTNKALIVFAVEHDKPDHTTNLTNIILKSKKWRKYSRKEGDNVPRHLLVLGQNALAVKCAVRYTNYKSSHTLPALIDSVFRNVSIIGKWKSRWKDVALRIVIEVHGKTVSEYPERTQDVMELFRNIKIGSHLGDYKQSLLHICVIYRNDYLLELALKHRKVEINRTDYLGQTPLHTAVQDSNLEAVKILIKYGAVIEIRDKDGNTAIHLAVHKSTNILEELICVNGTDVNVRNNAGKTPYQLACELSKTEHIKTLEKADINDQ
ncbi:hypothetical protein CHS0354_031005 [Potamilus streckersoni]|uniref:Uncharacterized protein n=1 Tax=Potamilus streckersoni TaxID=2493646 RepID=A0AAE0S361_9BIVA|nr:hypothetical protein CHS0354_031005 [Potamilus streckersoni]